MTRKLEYQGDTPKVFQGVGVLEPGDTRVYLDTVAKQLLARGDFGEVAEHDHVPPVEPEQQEPKKATESKASLKPKATSKLVEEETGVDSDASKPTGG